MNTQSLAVRPTAVLARSVLAALGLAALALGCRSGKGAAGVISTPLLSEPTRAMWVTRFDYKTESDVIKVVDDCASAGIDTILFQVRGNATAFYRSSIEPWAIELGGADPGFDPLEVALREAHARGIELHAWVNVMPAWYGTVPPTDPKQIYNAKPGWMWFDQNGKRQALSDEFYASVNPCLPEVRDYLVEVMRDLVARYRVDGLHLDYLRFPNEPPGTPSGSNLDYPRDERTLQLFLGETGKRPDQDRAAWNAWRAEQVTNLLRDIRYMIGRTRASIELSAAVGADPDLALAHHFQDSRTWLAEKLLDRVYPMNYAADMATFERRAEIWSEIAPAKKVVMGLRIDLGAQDLAARQMELAEDDFAGFSLFAYAAMFESPSSKVAADDLTTRFERNERRKTLIPYIKGDAKP